MEPREEIDYWRERTERAESTLRSLLPLLSRIGHTSHEEQAAIREARIVCRGAREMSEPVPTSLTILGLAPGETPRVRLTFDSAVTVEQACETANRYAWIGLGVQAKRLDDMTWEFVLG